MGHKQLSPKRLLPEDFSPHSHCNENLTSRNIQNSLPSILQVLVDIVAEPRGRGSAAARLLELRVRIPPAA